MVLTKEDGIVIYNIMYTSAIKDYIGKAKIEIVSTLPAEIDIDKSKLAGGIYHEATHTITWTEEITNVDTFTDGNYTKEIAKPIIIVYKNQDVTQDLVNTVTGKTVTYYPEVYLDKGGQEFVKQTVIAEAAVKQDYKVNFKVTAIWEDNKNRKEKRPEKVTVEIKVMPNDKIVTKELTEENNWTYEEQGLPKYNMAGERITYIITQKETEEGDLEYYEDAIITETETQKEDVTDDTFTIINEYRLMNTDLNTEITVEGTEEIESKEDEIEYTINLKSRISDYIGEGKIIIIDTLPYKIDLEKSDIGNGRYDEERNLIIWEEELPHINTEETKENYNIDTTKQIKLKYIGIDLSEEKMTNHIKAKIELYETEEKDERISNFDTNINVQGKVVVKYIDKDTKEEIAESYEIIDKIGKEYHTIKKEIEGYDYVEITENEEKIKEETQEVIYYYRKLNFNIGVEKTIESINLNGEDINITDNKLERIELKSNEIDNVNLMIRYLIKVTNKGELAGIAKVLEEIPQGYQLEEASEYWKINEDGKLETEVELDVGESKELIVIQKWINNEENIGLKSSTVKIESTENIVNYIDINTGDDISTTNIMISIQEWDEEPSEGSNDKDDERPSEGSDDKDDERPSEGSDDNQNEEPDDNQSEEPSEGLDDNQNGEKNQGINKELNIGQDQKNNEIQNQKVQGEKNQQDKYEQEEESMEKEIMLADNLYTGDEIEFIVIVGIVLIGINLLYFVVKIKRQV